MRSYSIAPTPARGKYLRQQQNDPLFGLTYSNKLYFVQNASSTPSEQSQVNSFLLLQDGVSRLLLQDGSSKLLLQQSSQTTNSCIYAFVDSDPEYYAGIGTMVPTGTASENRSLTFSRKFLKPGQLIQFIITGSFTSNAADSGIQMSMKFPHDGTVSTASTPATITANALGEFKSTFSSTIGYDSSNNGVIRSSGIFEISDSTTSAATDIAFFNEVENTFTFGQEINYLPQFLFTGSGSSLVTFKQAVLLLI